MQKTTLSLAMVLVGLVVSQSAISATINILSDDFNRADSNTVDSSVWTEINRDANDVAIYRNTLRIRDDASGTYDGAVTTKNSFSTLGMSNLSLSFDWKALPASDNNDYLRLSWSTNNSSWDSINFDATHDKLGLGDNPVVWHTATLDSSMLGSINNLSSVYLRFWIDLNNNDDDDDDERGNKGVQLDNIVLSQTTQSPAPAPAPIVPDPNNVPEPSNLALMGLGLLSMTFVMRKKGIRQG